VRSPNTGVELRQLDGAAGTVGTRGDDWISLAAEMAHTAGEMTAIGDSSVHKSKGTDKLAEAAAEVAADLSSAATRYELTGAALKSYAESLETAQNWLQRNLADVEANELAYQNALTDRDDALSRQSSLQAVWLWESEPTPTQLSRAAQEVGDARSALSSATTNRDESWAEFDHVFATWSDAYDEAVEAIQQAFDSAGNNDGFWEWVDATLEVLGWVLLVLGVIALIIGAPLTGLLGGIILALSAVVLLLNGLKYVFGRATLGDVAMAAVGLLPFGVGKILSRGMPTLGNVLSSGRGAITTAIRGGLRSPWGSIGPSWFRVPTFNPFQAAGNAWTWLRAPATARSAVPFPGLLVNPLRAIPQGGADAVQIQSVLTSLSNSRWATNPAVQQVVTTTQNALPGLGRQLVNSGVWGVFTANDIAGVSGYNPLAGWDPPIPILSGLRVS